MWARRFPNLLPSGLFPEQTIDPARLDREEWRQAVHRFAHERPRRPPPQPRDDPAEVCRTKTYQRTDGMRGAMNRETAPFLVAGSLVISLHVCDESVPTSANRADVVPIGKRAPKQAMQLRCRPGLICRSRALVPIYRTSTWLCLSDTQQAWRHQSLGTSLKEQGAAATVPPARERFRRKTGTISRSSICHSWGRSVGYDRRIYPPDDDCRSVHS
jgi:hypothetical protein